jgi:hypothetical protein
VAIAILLGSAFFLVIIACIGGDAAAFYRGAAYVKMVACLVLCAHAGYLVSLTASLLGCVMRDVPHKHYYVIKTGLWCDLNAVFSAP